MNEEGGNRRALICERSTAIIGGGCWPICSLRFRNDMPALSSVVVATLPSSWTIELCVWPYGMSDSNGGMTFPTKGCVAKF